MTVDCPLGEILKVWWVLGCQLVPVCPAEASVAWHHCQPRLVFLGRRVLHRMQRCPCPPAEVVLANYLKRARAKRASDFGGNSAGGLVTTLAKIGLGLHVTYLLWRLALATNYHGGLVGGQLPTALDAGSNYGGHVSPEIVGGVLPAQLLPLILNDPVRQVALV